MRPALRLAAIGSLCLAACQPAFGHGASRGLHLHVRPEPAVTGAEVQVAADAAEPLVALRVAFAGAEPVRATARPPSKRIVARLAVPRLRPSTAVNVQAEATTAAGRTLRASAIVLLAGRPKEPSAAAPQQAPGQRLR